jgi:hypothetical protein
LPEGLRVLLMAHKAEVLALLQGRLCPECHQPLDSKRVCWHCDWRICSICGHRITGSPFLSSCLLCDMGQKGCA